MTIGSIPIAAHAILTPFVGILALANSAVDISAVACAALSILFSSTCTLNLLVSVI